LEARFHFEDLGRELEQYKNIFGFININPMDKDAGFQLERGVTKFNYKGLKLHPRLNGYRADHPNVKKLFKKAYELGVPTLVDAFPDGDSLLLGFDVSQMGG
jgi:predicted TIM-barrel fold metal-dependent hydrolase